MGGVGKTRLAVEVGRRSSASFEDGAVFVAAEKAESTDELFLAIADAAGLRLASPEPVKARVESWIADSSALLILDNFEQLAEQAGELPGLLRISPHSKIITTSRVPLDLDEEWIFPLEGLPVSANVVDADAVSLFMTVARKTNPAFEIQADSREYALVGEICDSVGGLPLAIEMAAAWTRTLSLMDIATELKHGTDLLVTTRRDKPSRHQSIQAVFDGSWHLMTGNQRRQLKSLALLRGPFDRNVAMRVAGLSNLDLAALVDMSLLKRGADGLYSCHTVLRECTLAKEVDGFNEIAVRLKIATHYSDIAKNLLPGKTEMSELELSKLADEQFENFKQSIEIATEFSEWEVTKYLVLFFGLYMEFRSRYLDGMQVVQDVADSLEPHSNTKARQLRATALSIIGWWHLRLGNTDLALEKAEEAIAEYGLSGESTDHFFGDDPELLKGFLAVVAGDPVAGRRIAENKLTRAQAIGNIPAGILSQYLLATIQMNAGEFEQADRSARDLIDLVRETGGEWFEAYCLNLQGDLAAARGDYSKASGLFRRSYTIREQFDDPVGMGEALIKLGEVSLITGDFEEAEESFIDSRSAMETAGDRGNMGIALAGLGLSLAGQQRHREAMGVLADALEIGNRLRFTGLILRATVGLARIHLSTGDKKLAQAAMQYVMTHPVCDVFTAAMAGSVTRPLSIKSDEQQSPQAMDSTSVQLAQFSAGLLDGSRLNFEPVTRTDTPGGLSAREVDILSLMAGGSTNPEIAERLIVSPGTVKWYSSQIYAKLQVRNRAQAISKARELSIF